jgi:hypothetical protein
MESNQFYVTGNVLVEVLWLETDMDVEGVSSKERLSSSHLVV